MIKPVILKAEFAKVTSIPFFIFMAGDEPLKHDQWNLGEILKTVNPHYPAIPPEFANDLIRGLDVTAYTLVYGKYVFFKYEKRKEPLNVPFTMHARSSPFKFKGKYLNYNLDDMDAEDEELPAGIRKLIAARLKPVTDLFNKKKKIPNFEPTIKPKQSVITWAMRHYDELIIPSKHPFMNTLDPHKGAFIRTLSGKFVDVQFPTPDMFEITDIAHGLAGEFRWCNQTEEYFTVAQHSIEMSRRAPYKLRLAALLHDAPEFILKDLPKPVKLLLDEYKRLEDGVMQVIANKFGVTFPFDPEIKRLDTILLEWEYKNLMLGERERFFVVMSPRVAKEAFLKRYYELIAEA